MLRHAADLPSALRDALGTDAADDLAMILDEMRAEHAEQRAEIRAEFADFRREMQTQFQAIDARFDAIDARFDAIDARFDRVEQRFQVLEIRTGDVKADLMKWSFVFWVGAVTAIALLAGVLDR